MKVLLDLEQDLPVFGSLGAEFLFVYFYCVCVQFSILESRVADAHLILIFFAPASVLLGSVATLGLRRRKAPFAIRTFDLERFRAVFGNLGCSFRHFLWCFWLLGDGFRGFLLEQK